MEAQNVAEAPAGEKKSGPGMAVTAGLGAIVLALSGAGSYFLTPAPNADVSASHAAGGHDADAAKQVSKKHNSSHDKIKKGDKHSPDGPDIENVTVQIINDAAYVEFKSLVISISPIGRSKHLRVSLVLEAGADQADAILARAFYIKEAFSIYLRSVDAADLENPATMARLRAQLLRRAQVVATDATIRNVLITEFILT